MNKLIQANIRLLNKICFITKTKTSLFHYQIKSLSTQLLPKSTVKERQGIYSFQRFYIKRKSRKYQNQSESNTNDTFNYSEDLPFSQNYNEDRLTLHIKEFKNDSIKVLDQNNFKMTFFGLSIIGYMLVCALLLNEIRKAYQNSNQSKWKRCLKVILALLVLTYLVLRFYYKYELSKITIKNISLQSNGQMINIKYFMPKTINVNISDFKKIPKEELFGMDPELINLAMSQESYLVAIKDNAYLVPADSIIYEKDILYQISSSKYINVIK